MKIIVSLLLSVCPMAFAVDAKPSPGTHSTTFQYTTDPKQGDAYDAANRMDLETEQRIYPSVKTLWQRIDRHLGYPDDFVRRRIEGEATVQIEVDRKGVFTGRILAVSGDQDMLNTYLATVAVHALKEPLPEQKWFESDSNYLIVRSEFRVFSVGEVPRPLKKEQVKNILGFERRAYADPKLREVLDRLLTHTLPPIIPIPGGAYIDFPRAYHLIKNYGKRDPEELRSIRLQNRKEEWDRIIRQR